MKIIGKFSMFLILGAMASGCSVSQIVNDFISIPENIQADQLYWNPAHISSEGCPDLDGTYLIPATGYAGSIPGIPRVVPREAKSGGYVDTTVSIRSYSGGLKFHGQSPEESSILLIEFDSFFGCYDGIYVRRHRPFVSSGAETARCDEVIYAEDHWKLDGDGNLAVTTFRRRRCWLNRMSRDSAHDRVPRVVTHQKVD